MPTVGVSASFLLFASASADVLLSRTINALGAGNTAVVNVGGTACSQHDQYGSNGCDVHWGQSLTVDYDLTLGHDLTTGSKIDVDATIDNIMPFKFSCAACGANCSVIVPIIKKSITVSMPACPIAAAHLKDTITKTLPTSSPIPIKTSFKGNVKVSDASGAVVADVDVEGRVGPSGLALELERDVEEIH